MMIALAYIFLSCLEAAEDEEKKRVATSPHVKFDVVTRIFAFFLRDFVMVRCCCETPFRTVPVSSSNWSSCQVVVVVGVSLSTPYIV